jgi:ABC-type multidrug transport system ATPase subunit/ABC-type transport system involved in multi-copper enzyme maturation permease subunit
MPALRTRAIAKRYGGHLAVRGIDLEVDAGVIHGLLGPNGAGKTTLLRILLGLVAPSGGEAQLLSGPAGTASPAASGGVAGFADAPHFYPYLSGRQNLRLLQRLDGGTGDVDRALAKAGLGDAADTRVVGYSAGMRQRLGLASALLRAPRVLLLDEPTGALDPAGARELRETIRRLAEDGVAILLSSHDMAEVEGICTSLTILDRGEAVFTGTVDELRRMFPESAHRLVTSDDPRARAIAHDVDGVRVADAPDGGGLDVEAEPGALDRYVVALGRNDIAVRNLGGRERSLEELFLRLTTASGHREEKFRTAPLSTPPRQNTNARANPRGIAAVVRVELAKLAAQAKVWVTLGACLVAPLAFVAVLFGQASLPEDTLFGRWAKASGFAAPLVVLGFGGTWVFPVLTSVVGGDIFAADDRYSTWPTLLTRSRTRGEVFAGKVLAALAFSAAAVVLLAGSSIAAGLLVVGAQPLLGLSGTLLAPGRALNLVVLAWATVVPPVLGFTGLALLVSVATRSSAAGIALPIVLGSAMQLYAFVDGPALAHRLLLGTALGAWHGLFVEPAFYGPLVDGTVVGVLVFAASVAVAFYLFRRRDFGS